MLRFLLYFNAFTDAFRRPLSESSIVGNRDKRSVITLYNKRERSFKRPRTNSQLSSSPMPSFQASIPASDASSPPPSQTSQDASHPSAENQEVNEEALDTDPTKESLKDISNNFFENIELISNDFFEDIELLDDLSPFSPYLSPPQSPARLRRYIARHPYTEEPERYYLSLMNVIYNRCDAASFKNETERWCCDKGNIEVAGSETVIKEDQPKKNDPVFETRINDSANPVNQDENVINKILHFMKSGTITLTDDCKKFRRHSVQYNNVAFMASQQITINHAIASYTCKVQRAITTHMFALTPSKGEKSTFDQVNPYSTSTYVYTPRSSPMTSYMWSSVESSARPSCSLWPQAIYQGSNQVHRRGV